MAIVLIIPSAFVHGQTVKFEHINTADGLSQNSVVDIIQDKYGFIWMATQDGLNRYDGTNFIQYPRYFRDITRTTYTQLGSLYNVDSLLWLTTLTGELQLLNISEQSFKEFKEFEEVSTLINHDNKYWIGTYGKGLHEVTYSDSMIVLGTYLKGYQINELKTIGNEILVATDKGIYSKTASSNYKIKYPSLSNKSISTIEANEDMVLIGTHGSGLYISKNGAHLKQSELIPYNTVVHDVLVDKNQGIWIATFGSGLYHISSEEKVSQYLFDERDPYSISYNDVLSLMEDKKDHIWIGTDGGGISIFRNKFQRIKGISRSQMPKEFPVDVVRAIETDEKGYIWIGTSGKGLTRVSQNLEFPIHFSSKSKTRKLKSDRIVSLKRKSNLLWIGYQEGGLEYLNLDNLDINDVAHLSFLETIWDIDVDSKGKLWLATRSNGLVRYNPVNSEIFQVTQSKTQDKIHSDNIRVLVVSSEDEIFFGTEEGKIFHLADEYNVTQLQGLRSDETGPIKSLYLDEKNSLLWIGTQRKGILKYDLNQHKYEEINRTTGLPNNTIYSILPDENDYLWISTNKGICQIQKTYNPSSSSLVNQCLTVSNGLVSDEYNTGAYHIDTKGQLYFGALDGINWFDPSDMTLDKTSNDLILLELKSLGKTQQESYPLFGRKQIQLNHSQKDFQIMFSEIGFPEEGRAYEYRLSRLQENWNFNDKSNIAQYTNVPPGVYSFQLRKPAQSGHSASAIKSIDILISHPWWTTWWFRILVIAGLFSVFTWAYRGRIRFIKTREANKYAVQQQVNDLELQVLRAQMNPHFMFNSLNTIKNYILKAKPQEAAEYLSNFSHLIRQILQNSRQKTISFQEELDALLLYIDLEKLRFRNGFEFHLFVGENVDLNETSIPPLIIQPYVENAIWHGLLHKKSDRQLTLKVYRDNGNLKIVIEDNGIGRAKAQELKSKSATKYKSLGMGITKDRIELNNKLSEVGIGLEIEDLHNENASPKGTRVILSMHINEII